MKFINIFVMLLFVAYKIFSQEADHKITAEEKIWMEYMTPGEMHQLLANHAGEWITKTSYWTSPDSEPIVSDGKSKNEMIMGGRYLSSSHSGSAWEMPFEGMSIEGYDNAIKEFTSVWIDNLGTGIAIAKGKYDEINKSFVYNGSMLDPISKSEMKFKQIIEDINENTHIIKLFMSYDGQEFKNMEILFTRK